ncbi:C45 family autoproteolytic acyltransferase/hydolase [Georgenia halophila]|uniref:C45 family autoproteolytic acyltransferase/hydolase n=1 Tax=Georgenia halophila TaxID=620889 RepID=A0ABP8L295_9MICO
MKVDTWSSGETSAVRFGEAYGARWAPQLAVATADYRDLFAAFGMPTEDWRELAETSRIAAAEHAPGVAAELDGVARGSGLEPWQVMALNARTEILAVARAGLQECSTAVYLPRDGSAPRTLQTWDWNVGVGDEGIARSFRTADGTGLVTVGEHGQAAKFGVSSRGVGVHLNILNHADDGAGGGVPVHVLARLILEQASDLDGAVRIAESVPVSASTVLTVVTREPAAACLEISPAGVGVVPAAPGVPLVHANHFLDPVLAAGEAVAGDSTTYARMACLTEHAELAAIPAPLDRALAFGALPDPAISVRPNPVLPPHRRPETKLTIAIDVAGAAVEYHPGAPADVTAEGWRRVAAPQVEAAVGP